MFSILLENEDLTKEVLLEKMGKLQGLSKLIFKILLV
jgi:hypothetical protein